MKVFTNTVSKQEEKPAKTIMSGISETEVGPPPVYGGSQLALNPEEMFVASINNSKAVHNKASRILYNSVKAGRTKTMTQSMKNFVKPLRAKAGRLGAIEAKNAGDDLVAAIIDLPDQLS